LVAVVRHKVPRVLVEHYVLVVLDYNLLLHYVVRINEVVLLWANYLDWLLAHAWEPLLPLPPEWVVATTILVIVFLGLCRFF
jgi:hypothetical protein